MNGKFLFIFNMVQYYKRQICKSKFQNLVYFVYILVYAYACTRIHNLKFCIKAALLYEFTFIKTEKKKTNFII